MDTRREFLRKAMLLSGAAGMTTLPPSILKALSIHPDQGSTFMDAEHIVLLMQENRSFDHTFGTLRGVRGFNDPRAMTLPNKNKVWLQSNANGDTYTPFRLDIKDTKITWMGSLPHGRESQVEARNNGRHDNWIEAKKSGDDAYKAMPLTMGYYTREDIPFYYALADAFTICDQNFCSSLTPTDPNRLHWWSGTVRGEHDEDSRAFIDNGSTEEGVDWRTFPELLEQNNISWKIYQNEIGVDGGFTGEEDSWLGNFGDNTLEYFNQYNVKLSKRYINYLPQKIAKLQNAVTETQAKIKALSEGSKELEEAQKHLQHLQNSLTVAKDDSKKYTLEKYKDLSPKAKAIHEKAFAVNSKDPNQHKLTPLNYNDGDTGREINIPKGDVLHQFREDVNNNKLPTVTWLVPPENFSDHPSAPWFGSWYVSEVMDILTKNPEVWKKTIFVLAYDENDGYFDHVPPFTAPDSRDPNSGKVSGGIDTRLDYVKLEKDTPGPIGLGFRVPLIVASPWSRGGFVNSQVFDHTSTLQFLELFLNKKFKKNILETNITPWRRMICGDLTSVFRKYNVDKIAGLPFVKKDPFIETIHNAKFKNVPSNFKALTQDEIKQANDKPGASRYIPQQEKGSRPSCALPYELYADGYLDGEMFKINLGAGNKLFKDAAKGSPFIVFARNYQQQDFGIRNYAAAPANRLQDSWALSDFANGNYNLEVYGPNGFFREFQGNASDPLFSVSLSLDAEGKAKINFNNTSSNNYELEITDHGYGIGKSTQQIVANTAAALDIPGLDTTSGWYDFSIKIKGSDAFEKRYAGRIETGKDSVSDPAIG